MNRSYLAHIVADSAKGPRGSKEESELLKDSLSNIMLLCGDHHRLIDGEHWQEYPTEWLREQKQEHEDRIERQTGLQPAMRTHLVLIGTRVGNRRGDGAVNEDEARTAVLPARYPATDRAIRVNLSELELTEQDPTFWQVARTHAERCLAPVIAGIDITGRPINHLSIFGLAAIPVLIYCGSLISDLITADVYQRHRVPTTWDWQPLAGDGFDYLVTTPEAANSSCIVAINLSLSGPIHQHEIDRAMGHAVPTYGITIAEPTVHFLKAKEQLELFTKAWRRLLSQIRQHHGEECEIHLFPAVPVSIAIEIGRALLPKVDPTIHVYNLDRASATFHPVLTIA
ncbi:SAVED domain-containing protein [Hymenobacter sp. BT635]|uniref:SAVED domain-containing protein n=1 Tax=Hymenobacter nitidus TaxID=2880929 RepID=A0ABS8AJ65_9BACT|nr:SAVED domain-containing protein [Hymenobacter nitidus]MCB2380326.1 SAVED domain-containing protein [Hymenobacter nitidus]